MTYAATEAWLRPRLWLAAVVGAVPWVVWVGSLALGGWYKDAEGKLICCDHLAFYTAAHLIRDGAPGRMYDYLDLTEYQPSLIGWNWGGFEAYRNPPFYALLYLPTASLSYYGSMLVWMALSFALIPVAIWLLHPQKPGRVLLWSLAFYPVFATISFGQNTCMSLAIFAGIYRLLEKQRPFAAGLLAGLLWFKPQLLLGFLVWWVASPRRYFQSWLGLSATGLALAAVSWLVLPEASDAFVEKLSVIAGFHGFGLWNVHTPKAFFEMLEPEWSKREVGGVISLNSLLAAAVSCFSIAIALAIAIRSGTAVATMFPIAVFLSLWASPHALIYEWALLVPACVVVWENYPQRRHVWLCLFALTWIALTISTPIALLQETKLHLPHVLQISVPILGAVGCLAARELFLARSVRTQQGTNTDREIALSR